MGSGCTGTSRYQTSQGNDDDCFALKQPKHAPPEVVVNGAPSPTSVSNGQSVAQLRQRLKELGWKEKDVVEKSELQRMVKEAEEYHARQLEEREAAKVNQTSAGALPPIPPATTTTPTVTTASTRNAQKSGSSLGQMSPTGSSSCRPGSEPLARTLSPRSSRSVPELKRRLQELGYVIPVHLNEKQDLVALVAQAEEYVSEKQKPPPCEPSSASAPKRQPSMQLPPTPPRSVAELKSRLQELGVKVPHAVEKRELVILIEEAERQLEQKSGKDTTPLHPSSPSTGLREKRVKCKKTTLGVAKIQISEEPFAPASPHHAEVIEGSVFTWTKGKLIGRGALGLVYLAEVPGRTIAVKEVMIDTAERRETKFKEDLENEIQIMKEMSHANIVAYLGHDYIDDRLFIYLDYMPGGSISHVLREHGPFEESLLARYSKQLLKGLEYLHTQSPPVIHRDIKGGNVLIGRDDIVKWADFGCSKRLDNEATQTMLRGSIPWMAPEVVTHSRYGWFSDVWSFGCLVIEMGTARQPWGRFENQVAALMKIGMSNETPPLPEGVSDDCQGFITQCCQRDPESRSKSSELLRHALLREVPDE